MDLFRSAVLCCFVVLVKCACKNNERHLYYKELQCKPVVTDDPNCPSSYDCSHISQRTKDKCYYKFKEYSQGEDLPSSVFADSPSTAACKCKSYNNRAKLECVTAEYPDEILRSSPGEGGDKCSSKTDCGPEKAATCSYKGKDYLEGQIIYPKDQPCLKCTCKADFNGTLSEPWCNTIKCQYELHYSDELQEGCAPVFYKELSCCPIEWKCPNEEKYRVVPGPNAKTDDSSHINEKCRFGNVELNINDKVVMDKDDVDCTCVLPPHVFCVKKQK